MGYGKMRFREREEVTDQARRGPFYAFGPYRFDSDSRTLYRDGDDLHLRPKAGDLLFVLITAQGRLLSKEEILREYIDHPETYVRPDTK